MDKAADDADRDITTGIIVAIVFIGLIALAVSEVDTQQPASTDLRDCFVSNKAGLSLEMFVDGQPVGLLEAGGTLEVALERGRHEFSWYQYWGSAARQAAHQVLEVGSEPGHYELTLQPVSAGS